MNFKHDRKINIKDIYILCISTVIIFFGNLVSFSSFRLNEFVTDRYLLVFVLLILLFSYIRWRSPYNLQFLVIWFLFIISILFSKIINEEYNLIDIFVLMVFVPWLFRIERRYLYLLCWSTTIAFIPFIFEYGVNGFNSYGITTALIGINTAILLYLSNRQNSFRISVLILITTVLLIYLRSRTALISFLIGGFVLIYFSINKIKSKKKFFYYILFSTSIILFCYFYLDAISNLIFNKWQVSEEDITTGRAEIWTYLFSNDISIFGKGSSYFWNTFEHMDAHNIFMQLLGRYGLVSMVLFLVLVLYILKLIIQVNAKERIAFLAFFGVYFALGMFENTLFVDIKTFSISLLFIIYIAMLLQANKRNS
ncbi:O-antigen ligase family protein [Chengkuizengella sp. SCS-71B]|uniref:O-antigen ligase family protein n=1 Tax=Chengkuizengella sp. SCS-71B TaxID=3115290 RepID=UPI0032C215F4